MKFSVIVPVYNVKNYLRQCLQSVLLQNFKDYELILVDDGSTDGSGALCDEYAKQYSQVNVVHQQNGGLSAARNSGVRVSRGEYILFLDSDDWWLSSSSLERIARCANDSDLVMFDVQEVTPNSKKDLLLTANLRSAYPSGISFLSEALKINPHYRWYAWMYAYKRSFWVENNFSYPEGYRYEDIGTTYKVLLAAKRVAVLSQTIYAYRREREGSITSNLSSQAVQDWLELEFKMANDVVQRSLPRELEERLIASVAFAYFGILIQVNRVQDNSERKKIYSQLKKEKWVARYAIKYGRKYRFATLLLSIFGVKFLSKLFGLRMKLKKYSIETH